MSDSYPSLVEQLIDAGKRLDQRGWVPATSGNLSARLPDGRIVMTVSGKHKGMLEPEDLMLVDAQGQSLDGRRPSAETLLHAQIYQRHPKVGSVLHPHSQGAVLLSLLEKHVVELEGYELLKAFEGIETHDTALRIPIFPNDQNMARLSQEIDTWMDRNGEIRAYILRQHGFYTWGRSVGDTMRQVEALEFMFSLETCLRGHPYHDTASHLP